MAERVGFEPTKGYKPLLVFKTSAFNRSATSPNSAYPDPALSGGIDSDRFWAILTLRATRLSPLRRQLLAQLVEPTKGYKPLLVFKTSAFNRSATSPVSGFAPRIVLAIEPKHKLSV